MVSTRHSGEGRNLSTAIMSSRKIPAFAGITIIGVNRRNLELT
jgi:hypothetical protein